MDDKAPMLVQLVQDRDLWKFNLPNCKEVMAAVALEYKTFGKWDYLDERLENSFELENHGEVLLRQHQKHCADIIRGGVRDIVIDGMYGACVNCTPQFASDVGNILAKEYLFGATWHTESSGDVKFSLRSIGDFDVSIVAEKFGGGGHKNAAGFTLEATLVNNPEDVAGLRLWSTAPKTPDFSDLD
jgi:oligoribonuclease NrnB/cAMP/cGMP phosphodiesterase (DHH superfamily)